MRFEIHESVERGMTVLQPDGDLNERSSEVLQEKIAELMEAGVRLVIIDLELTSAASSHAFRMLLMVSKKLQSIGGRLVVCGAQSGVESALKLSGLTRLCCVRADRAAGLKELMVEGRIDKLAKLVAKLLGAAEERRRAAEAV
jgi:anti-anti-sigma factor